MAVTDSGLGLTTADWQEIFGQGGPHSTLRTAREKGMGLGLLLCKDFVERNGGALTFESQPGQSPTFRSTLPGCAWTRLLVLLPDKRAVYHAFRQPLPVGLAQGQALTAHAYLLTAYRFDVHGIYQVRAVGAHKQAIG